MGAPWRDLAAPRQCRCQPSGRDAAPVRGFRFRIAGGGIARGATARGCAELGGGFAGFGAHAGDQQALLEALLRGDGLGTGRRKVILRGGLGGGCRPVAPEGASALALAAPDRSDGLAAVLAVSSLPEFAATGVAPALAVVSSMAVSTAETVTGAVVSGSAGLATGCAAEGEKRPAAALVIIPSILLTFLIVTAFACGRSVEKVGRQIDL